MKILILDRATTASNEKDIDFSGFDKLSETKTIIYNNLRNLEEILQVIDGINIIVTNKVALNADLIARLPETVKLIAITATGYDNIDLTAATKHGIKVANVPGYGTNAVSQLAMLFILACSVQFVPQIDYLRKNGWNKAAGLAISMYELAGKTLGIVGLGEIGAAVAKLGLAFDMQIIAYNRSQKNTPNIHQVSLHEVAAESDFISLNCALTVQTKHIVNAEFLSKMKPTAFLINTARGGLIDEEALISALNQKQIAGAALDVMNSEPPARDNPLLSMDNVILTPHIGWAPVETRQRCIDITIENIKNFMNGIKSNLLN